MQTQINTVNNNLIEKLTYQELNFDNKCDVISEIQAQHFDEFVNARNQSSTDIAAIKQKDTT